MCPIKAFKKRSGMSTKACILNIQDAKHMCHSYAIQVCLNPRLKVCRISLTISAPVRPASRQNFKYSL